MELKELVAEGDAVVARFGYVIAPDTGESITVRGLAWYRLAGGRIVEDDAVTSPDLTQLFAAQMPASATS
jgi:hypothetical protein